MRVPRDVRLNVPTNTEDMKRLPYSTEDNVVTPMSANTKHPLPQRFILQPGWSSEADDMHALQTCYSI